VLAGNGRNRHIAARCPERAGVEDAAAHQPEGLTVGHFQDPLVEDRAGASVKHEVGGIAGQGGIVIIASGLEEAVLKANAGCRCGRKATGQIEARSLTKHDPGGVHQI